MAPLETQAQRELQDQSVPSFGKRIDAVMPAQSGQSYEVSIHDDTDATFFHEKNGKAGNNARCKEILRSMSC